MLLFLLPKKVKSLRKTVYIRKRPLNTPYEFIL